MSLWRKTSSTCRILLKETALSWFSRQTIHYWDDAVWLSHAFVQLFRIEFYNPFRIGQWKYQLHNRKQKPGETVDDYTAAIKKLWKRVDPGRNRTELDRLHEFIEGLRSEFIVPVQSSMPIFVEEAIEKAKALETAFSMGMELSAYSMIPGYLQSIGGTMLLARTNMTMFQPTYTSYTSRESEFTNIIYILQNGSH